MKKRIIALTVSLLIALSAFGPAYAAEYGMVTFTALGDSIAAGTGGTGSEGYTDRLEDFFTKTNQDVVFCDMSADGLTSGQLLAALYDPYDSYHVQTAVAAADVITVSIGGNDLLGPFLEALFGLIYANYYDGESVDYTGLMADLEAWESDPESQPLLTAMLYSLTAEYAECVSAFRTNWYGIIDRMTYLNQDAEIYVNTVYNPFAFSAGLYAFADPFIRAINSAIYAYAPLYGYQIADVYTMFAGYGNPKKLAVGDLSNLMEFVSYIVANDGDISDFVGSVPLHPTDLGYKFIFNLHKDLME